MPDYMIPFVPIIHEDEAPFSMFRDLKQKYGEWVLDVLEYDSADGLLEVFEQAVVRPALEKAEQLLYKKTEEIRKRHVKDYKRILSPKHALQRTAALEVGPRAGIARGRGD
jgi:hypothetical protein